MQATISETAGLIGAILFRGISGGSGERPTPSPVPLNPSTAGYATRPWSGIQQRLLSLEEHEP